MLKHKKILSLLLVLPVFGVFSCSKPKEPYKVEKDDETHLQVVAQLPETIKSGEKLPIDQIHVFFDGNELKWLGEKNREFETEGKFFLVTNADYPTNSIVTNLEVTTNVERNDLNFYVSHFSKDTQTVYVSKVLKITILNDNAIKPWVWYVVTAVVVFGVIGMVMFTRYYKNKKAKSN